MLVNSDSSFSKDDVLALKNILGEEIICAFVEDDTTHITIKRPFAMAMTEQGPAFAPAVMFGEMEGEHKVLKSQYLWITKGNEAISAAYTQQVSGIMIPKENNKIIT